MLKKTVNTIKTTEYVYANMGWGIGKSLWVQRGVYDTWYDPDVVVEDFEADYSGYLYYLAGITPSQN